jgi:Flp pilus assembly protein TadD
MMVLAFLLMAECSAAEPRLREAKAALDAGSLKEAAAMLEPLQSEFPTCARVLAALGRLELERKNFSRAGTFSELAAITSPNEPEALALRGQVLAGQGRMEEARPLLERAVKLDPTHADAHFQLGIIYDRARLNSRAVTEFEKAVALRPNDPRAWDYLALNLEPMGEIGRAEAAYRSGLEANRGPRFDSFLDYNYGRLLLKLNRLEESKAHLGRAVELVPHMRAPHYDRAKLNVLLGDFPAARRDAERALSVPDPNGFILDLQVYSLLAQICTRLGDEECARKYIELSESTRVPLRSKERK